MQVVILILPCVMHSDVMVIYAITFTDVVQKVKGWLGGGAESPALLVNDNPNILEIFVLKEL